VLSTDLKESAVVSNLMDDFPPICKQDPLEVRVHYILDHFEKTGQTIKLNDIPDTMWWCPHYYINDFLHKLDMFFHISLQPM